MILSHDLGTTGNKATLVSNDGCLLASVTIGYPVDFGPGGRAEQQPDDWWNAVVEATRALLERSGTSAAEVDVVSFSGQMMGVVPIDRAGRVVRPAVIWADTRATTETDLLVERVGMSRAYSRTGHRLNPTYSLPKMMWLRTHEPDAFARTTTFLQAKDYVVLRLTGARVTDPSDASSTDAYDQVAGAWSEELLDAAEIPMGMLPKIVASTTVVGGITREAAAATGLLPGTRVVLGGGDGPVAALGAGIVDESSGAYAYLGSSSWVSISAPHPLHDPSMRSMTFNHVVPGQFVPTATMQAGGASLQWLVETLSPEEPQYGDLLSGAARAAAALDGLYFLPHLLGERSPYWNPHARAAFVGLRMHHDRGAITRAVLEGVAFNLRTGLLAFTENGRMIDAVDVIGGAANAGPLLDIAADVWDLPVRTRDLVDEANAVGAAVVGGVGVGIFDSFGVAAKFSTRSAERVPDPGRAAAYRGAYETFMDSYRRLEPWFDRLDT